MTNPPLPARSYSPINGPKIMAYGYPGVGKTHALRTLLDIDPSIELFIIFTDQCGPLVMGDLPAERVHWAFLPPSDNSWETMMKVAETVNKFSYESVAEMKAGIEKQKHRQWMEMLKLCNNFHDSRTGKEYGPIDQFPMNYILVFDGLTGISTMAKGLVVGAKPNPHQGEWGSAMSVVEDFITKLTQALWQWVIVLAHADREVDEVLATSIVTCSTLGRKLAPKLPALFTDVIINYRKGTSFLWSNLLPGFISKKQHLPFGDTLEPSYVPLAREWQKRGGLFLPEELR